MRSHDFAQWQDSSLPQESATPPQLSLIGVASRAEFRGAAKNEQTIKGDANVSAPSDAAYAQHRAELIALAASHISKTKDLDTFKANIDDFEKRMAANSRRDAQVDGTYQQIARLFSDSDQTTVPLKLRVRLAQQAMDHAAHPYLIDQGKHDTCNVGTVEVRCFVRTPFQATKLIADIASNNEYLSSDGRKVTLHQPSLEPDDEAKKDHTADQERSYASQVFQLTAANVHWFGAQRDFMGSPMQPGSLGYTQLPSERGYKLNGDGRFFDTGERLFDMSGDKPKLVTKDPGVRIGVLEHLANLISGDDDKGFVIEHRIGAAREGTATFGSAAELEKLLVDSKESFPLILRVHSANEPFNRCDGDWHAINIVAYDPATKKVSISNQWGKDSDRQVKLDQLYRASQESTTRFKCTPDESWPGSNPSSPGLPQRMGLPNNG